MKRRDRKPGKGQGQTPQPPPFASGSRAREASAVPEGTPPRPPTLDEILRVVGAATVDARIEVIARLMTSGGYYGTEYAVKRELADRWGLAFKTVENYACEASRLVRRPIDIAAASAELFDEQRRLARVAEQSGQITAAIKANDSAADIIGAKKQRLELTGKGGMPLGLPPAFALLLESLDPPATPAELEHYAAVDPEACRLEGCRMHPAAGGGGVERLRAAGGG